MEDNTSGSAPIADTSSAPVGENTSVDASTPDNTQALEAAVQNGTPKQVAQAKKMLREIKYKADGQEFTENLGFDIPEDQVEYMQKQLSMNRGAQKRMAEKAQLETEVRAFFDEFKKNPKMGMSKLGLDPKQFAAAMLEEELKMQSMTPEQREREELMAKLKLMEEERTKEKEDFSKKELERITQLEYDRVSTKIENALNTSGLPKEPAVVKRIANYMLIGNQMGVKFEPEELTELVRSDMYGEIQGLIKALGADKVEELIGKDILTQIRKKNVAKAKATTPATAKAGGPKDIGATKTEAKPAAKKSMKDFFGF